MEAFEAAKVVYNRILETESETITRKIIGYIYLLDHADREMIRLAFGPDNLIQTLIQKPKIELNLGPKPIPSPPVSPSLHPGPIFHSHRPFSTPSALQIPHPMALNYHDHFIGLGDQFDPFSRDVTSFPENGYSLMEVLVLEEEGAETRQRYVIISVEGIVNMGVIVNSFMQSMSDFNLTEFIEDQAAFSPGSLEKLEFEITEILKSRRGNPIWIASLPMIYYELYGRTLQAEGYLTESQTHGKAGYSLSRLLARLRNSIRLINRPHGQHAVVLAEDASRYMENRYERNSTSPGPIVSGSKQIYLTFLAESTFSEDDVADHLDYMIFKFTIN